MIPFSPPRIDDQITEAVTETIRSGWWTTGPRTKEFERQLTDFFGCRATLACASATAGMELVLRWFGVQEGDEVILPAYTYSSTANVVVHCGAKPVMVDVGEDFNISLEAIKAAITPRTKAIMPVDIGGFPCDYDEINALAASTAHQFEPRTAEQEQLGRVLVLSDSAHSVGARYKGKRTGAVTDVSVFSFHAVKNLATAEGGAIALNLPQPFDNAALYQRFNIMSLHGQNKDALAKVKLGGWRYDIVEAGYKCNMTDIQAAIGLVELARYDSDTLVRRKAIFDAYSAAFAQNDWAQVPVYETADKTSSYHVYPLRIHGISEGQRDAIIQRIYEQQVAVNVHFQPLPLFSFYKGLGYRMDDYPVAFDNYAREISLPVYYSLSDENIATVVGAVRSAVAAELANQPTN